MIVSKESTFKKINSRENKQWFNSECKNAKALCKNSLKSLHDKYSENNLNNFITDKRNYIKTIRQSKLTYDQEIKNKITNVKNNVEFWKTVKSFKLKTSPINDISLKNWERFYAEIFTPTLEPHIEFLDCLHPYFDIPITLQEIYKSLKKCKLNKAPGSDNLSNEFYINTPPNWHHYMQNFFNQIFTQEKIPKTWCLSQISLIYKKGDKQDPLNYRGIALLNTICKIFTQVLYFRMQNWCELNNILNECQAGFRQGRGTIDNIFTLTTLSHLQLRLKKHSVFAIFVDFRRAFDTINHNILWQKLYNNGISGKIIRILQQLYKNASLQVKLKGDLSKEIPITQGVLQGEILSPLLFSLFLNDIWTYFNNSGLHGINIDGYNDVTILAYADDLVILCHNMLDVKKKLNVLNQYCRKNLITVNINKTKILQFHKGRNKDLSDTFLFNGSKIEMVNTYNYLGLMFSSSGKFNIAAKEMHKKALFASMSVKTILSRTKSEGWAAKEKLLKSVVNATALYATEIWGPRYTDTIEKHKLYFIKTILQLPKNTPSHYVRLETGVEHTAIEVWKRTLGWWYRIQKMEEQRLPKIIYNRLLQLDQTDNNKPEYNWCTQIKNFLLELGFEKIWSNKTINKSIIDNILTKYSEKLKEQDINLVLQSRFNKHYKLCKNNSSPENYLSFSIPFPRIRILCQLRLANKNYIRLIHNGIRYEILTSEQCTICNLEKNESLFHIFFECPIYLSLRTNYLSNIRDITEEPDMYKLFSNLSIDKLNCIYYYILAALKLRSFIINE